MTSLIEGADKFIKEGYEKGKEISEKLKDSDMYKAG